MPFLHPRGKPLPPYISAKNVLKASSIPRPQSLPGPVAGLGTELPERPTAVQSSALSRIRTRANILTTVTAPKQEVEGEKTAPRTQDTPTVKSVLYQPLDPAKKEIRLVRLLKGNFEDTIMCTMHTVSLLEEPTYEALSYVWGRADDTTEINVGERVLNVTVNLHAALRRIRKTDASRDMWVDALSINQNDIVERGHQVRQMRDVYKVATNVIAWLGEESTDSRLGLRAFARLMDLSKVHWTGTMDNLSLDEESITAMHSLVNRPWWGRVWTLQEAILPERLNFLCGTQSVSSETLFGVSRSFFRHLNTCCVSFQGLCSDNLMKTMSTLCILDRYRHNYRETDLLRLVLEYRTRACSDPRDKVYGILGLVENDTTFNQIIPDYLKPIGIVYEEIAKAFISSSAWLDVLSLVLPGEGLSPEDIPWRPHHPKRERQLAMRLTPGSPWRLRRVAALSSGPPTSAQLMHLPSWAPNWAHGSSEDFQDAASRFERLTLYKACGNSHYTVQHRSNGSLSLSGRVIGRIIAVGEVAKTKNVQASIIAYKSWWAMARLDIMGSQHYRTFRNVEATDLDTTGPIFTGRFTEMDETSIQTMTDAFWLTLCSSVSSVGKDTVFVQDLDTHRRLYQLWWDWATRAKADPDKLDHALEGSSFARLDIFRATADILISTAMRRFAITDAVLGCIGLVPRNTKIGDEIVLFAGARVPMIVRKVADDEARNLKLDSVSGLKARFVGDAYIHGIMNGEVWDNMLEELCLV